MTIQTDDIAVFLTVVGEGSFGRAASVLMVSQPAVSERIARLERATGATLFRRSPRGTTLTPAGDAFLPYARRMIDVLDDAVTAVQALDAAPRLRVAVHTTFAHRAVPLVLGALPPLRRSVKVRDAHSDAVIAMLLDGVCDVGFVVPGARPPSLRFESLSPDPVVAVASPSHRLARSRLQLADLAHERVAFNRYGDKAEVFVERLRSAGVPEWGWTECSDTVTALHLAAVHNHVAMITASLADVHVRLGAIERLDVRQLPRWTMPLTLAFRERDRSEPAIAAVRSAVRRQKVSPRAGIPASAGR